MDKHGRVRLNITRNTKGWSYDITIEDSDADPLAVLDEMEHFKERVENRVEKWTLDLAEKAKEGA